MITKKKYISIGLSLLVLAGAIIGTAWWGKTSLTAIQNYRSPLRQAGLSPQPAVAPKSRPVVIVLVSGLGYDDSLALGLPALEQLKQAGATMAVESTPPTYSQTSWATLITGAPPETNDAPPVDLPQAKLHLLEVDTIFARAHQANLQTALLGTAAWRRLIPRNQLDYTYFTEQLGPEADATLMEAALPIIEKGEVELTLLQFNQMDLAGQNSNGPSSDAYRQAALQIDSYLAQISQAMDFSRSVLIVLSDHGHIPDGGHGGNEVEVIWQPLVIIGQGIIPGSYSDIHQTDVAPTVTALLGLAAPAASQGRILFELLRLEERERAATQLGLAQQRLTLAAAYINQIGGEPAPLPEALATDLTRAQAAFAANNLSGAFELALLTQQEADAHMLTFRNQRVATRQWLRLVIAGLVMLIWFGGMWRRRGVHAGSLLIAALLTAGLYHLLYQLQGHSYSVSALRDFSEWPFDIARRTAVSLLAGGGLVLIFLMLNREEDWLTLLSTGYGFGLLVTFIFALPLFWAYWQNGGSVSWYLPAIVPAFWQITGLLEVMIAAILGLLLPWPIMALNLFVNVTRRRLDESRARAESDALPGLHL
jgi:2,3-bisphosphoglycerate-independent phosphoglycerate mutase